MSDKLLSLNDLKDYVKNEIKANNERIDENSKDEYLSDSMKQHVLSTYQAASGTLRTLLHDIEQGDIMTIEPENDKTRADLGDTVYQIALGIFAACGAPVDCCVQHDGGDVIIFGGSNRLILRDTGWYASQWHCTPRFLEKFSEGNFGKVQ